MATASPASLITAEEFARMQFDQPVELVRGELFFPYGEDEMTRPSYGHGWVCAEIARLIGNWAIGSRQGRVVTNDSWIKTERDPDSVRGADVAYIRMERLPSGKLPLRPSDQVPDLCVEVLSPHDRWRDVHDKIAEYLACGVKEVWIVNPERRTVEVFREDVPPIVYQDQQQLTSSELPEFSTQVDSFFEGIS